MKIPLILVLGFLVMLAVITYGFITATLGHPLF